jgi:N-acetylglucosaminyl-diphospho-decaprenol L-rhamnosyltransferase
VSGRVGVVTVVHGRHEHLALQQAGLTASHRAPDVRVRVAMGDPEVTGPDVVALDVAPGRPLPVAAARNLGARTALDRGADVLVFLDVDCVPAPEALDAYADAVADEPGTVWCGPVTYLEAADRPYRLADLARLDAPHPARPAPAPGERLHDDRWALFWSLSFAVGAEAWDRCGGFDEAYVGYGGEDTDLGQRAARAGLRLGWLGAARAYHQHHPTSDPPVQHVADVVRNGRLFRDRWGWWPMGGWLEAFEARGLVRRVGDDWVLAT